MGLTVCTDNDEDRDDVVNYQRGWARAGNDEDGPGLAMMKRKVGAAGNEETDDRDNCLTLLNWRT